MKAAILYKSKSKLIVDNIKIPKKLLFGQVLVKIKYSGICGSQINEIDAAKTDQKNATESKVKSEKNESKFVEKNLKKTEFLINF